MDLAGNLPSHRENVLKILFCVEFYWPSVGGAQEVIRQLAERMVGKGHEVLLATTRLETRTAKNLNGVSIVEFDVVGNRAQGMLGEVLAYQDFLCAGNFDIVMIYAAQQWTFDAAWPVFFRMTAKKVFVPCGYSGLYLPAYENYFKELPTVLRELDALVYHASEYRDVDFARAHGITNEVIIPNGADLHEFEKTQSTDIRSKFGVPDGSLVILTVGSMTGMKGHRELLDAFLQADFGGRHATLILNGNNPYQGKAVRRGKMTRPSQQSMARVMVRCREAYKNHGLVHLLRRGGELIWWKMKGREEGAMPYIDPAKLDSDRNKKVVVVDLPRDQLIQAYLGADLFVFASNIEYSPLVLFEACAARLPFLTVPVGNSAEIVRWTGGGELCEADVDEAGFTRVSPVVLSKKMVEMLGRPDRLRELSENGLRAAHNRFNWNNLANEYENLFIRLCCSVPDCQIYGCHRV